MSGVRQSQHLKILLKEIELATKNFQTCIGKGGYGLVYKGELSISGTLTTVAVKRLNEQFGQGLKEFLTEIQLLTGQNHPNLISLLGYCNEGKEKIIVYEYAERGSLDRYLSSSNTSYPLTWLERLRVCVDAAQGLDHLHNHVGKHQTIIHRDIKSANILVDQNWVAKILDLGLSKLSLLGLDRSAVISRACGTPGYCEPEYITTGIVKKESDVYSFGMVLFEVLCGRLCSFRHQDGLLLSAPLAKDYYEKKKLTEIIDPGLREQMSFESMNKFSAIAYGCLQDDRGRRPTMDLVVKELVGSLEIQFFWINNDGKKCVLISASIFLNLDRAIYAKWAFEDDLRFSRVAACPYREFHDVQCQIKTSMLSLGTMYAAGLVFKYSGQPVEDLKRLRLIRSKWKTEEFSVYSIHVAELTPNNWYKIRMWHFINQVPNADFDIVIEELSYFEAPHLCDILIQGIEYQPIEMMQHEEIEQSKSLSDKRLSTLYSSVGQAFELHQQKGALLPSLCGLPWL